MSIEQLPAAAVKGEVLLMIRELPTANRQLLQDRTANLFVLRLAGVTGFE